MHHRTDYDFDVISGPSTRTTAPPTALPLAVPPPPSTGAAAAVVPSRPAGDARNGGDQEG